MGKWILQEGERFETGDDGQARLTQTYLAGRGQGLTEATRHGLARGSSIFKDGRMLLLSSINPRTTAAQDEVELQWVGPSGPPAPQRNARVRQAGDEQWSLQSSVEDVDFEDYVNADGEKPDWENLNMEAPDTLKQPRVMLVWKKWLKQPFPRGPKVQNLPLPMNQAEAEVMAGEYTLGGDTFEAVPPRSGCTLSDSVIGRKFLCVDLDVAEDGTLICRTAKFQYKPDSWDEEAYPNP